VWLYQLRWDGTDPDGNPWDPTWEPEENLNCPQLFEKFEKDWRERHPDGDDDEEAQEEDKDEKKVRKSTPKRNSNDTKKRKSSTGAASSESSEKVASKPAQSPRAPKKLKTQDWDAEEATVAASKDLGIPWDHPSITVALADHRKNPESGILEIHHLITYEGKDDLEKRWVPAAVTRHFAPRAAIDFYEKRIRFETDKKAK
jgi:hypothetical protein